MVRLFFVTAWILASAIAGFASSADSQTLLQTEDVINAMEKWEWHDCSPDPEAGIVQIESIVVTPDPPQPGKNLTVKVKGSAKQVIEDGAYADVIVKLGLIKLLQKKFDVCEEARNANASIQCPVQPGSYTVEQTVALPKEIPKAKFRVNVKGYSKDDEDMFCLDMLVDFMKIPFPRLAW